jgi:MOSC domain-containing protein YiiM
MPASIAVRRGGRHEPIARSQEERPAQPTIYLGPTRYHPGVPHPTPSPVPANPVLVQVNVSPGGMPKRPVLFGRVTAAGVDGDWQKNRKVHGGPDRAICIYSEELYAWLNEEGVRVGNGDVGENFTTRGLDLQKLSPGDRLHVGGDDGCTVEITKVRVPCFQLKKWDVDLPEMIVGRSGWMAKVVREGFARPGDPIAWTPREPPVSHGGGGAGAPPTRG